MGTLWHCADRIVAACFLCVACGSSTRSESRHDDDAGAGGASSSDGGSDAGADGGITKTSFDDGDPAPCGEGSVWDVIVEPAEEAARARLRRLFGEERGLFVYRGTATVRDRAAVSSSGDGELAGAVLAKLLPNGSEVFGMPGHVLTARSVAGGDDRYFTVYQPTDGTRTFVSALLPWAGFAANELEQNAEVLEGAVAPRLADAPNPLSFELSATRVTGQANASLEVEANATLERIEPVPFADLLALTPEGDSTLDGFMPSADGREFSRVITAVASVPSACVPEGSGFAPGECTYLATYFGEEYVDAAAIERHGIRAFAIQNAILHCYHCSRFEGVSDARRCVEGLRERHYP